MSHRHLIPSPLSPKRVLVSLVVAVLLAGASLAATQPASAAPSHPFTHHSGGGNGYWVNYSVTANTIQNFTVLGGSLSDTIVVTPNWDPGGVWSGGDTHPLGL